MCVCRRIYNDVHVNKHCCQVFLKTSRQITHQKPLEILFSEKCFKNIAKI